MMYEAFKDAVALSDAEQVEVFKKLAAERGETVEDVQSQYAMWLSECDETDPYVVWQARAETLGDGDKHLAQELLEELAAIESLDAFRRQGALELLCRQVNWSKTDCLKSLKPDYTAAKKRHADKLHAEKMAKKKARREADGSTRKHFHNYHHVPFSQLLGDAIQHLVSVNSEAPSVFVSGSDIVHLHTNTITQLKEVVTCDVESIRYTMGQVADWSKTAPDVNDGDDALDFKAKYSNCPKDVASAILSAEAAQLGLPSLNGLSHAPFFDRDGNLVVEPGYHRQSGYFYCPPTGAAAIPKVSQKPTSEEVAEALRLILFEAYGDFPFNDDEPMPENWFETDDPALKLSVGQSSRANQLAKTLQAFLAQMIPGTLPLHAVDKAAQRTGSQFMAEVLGVIITGSAPPMQAIPKTDEEWAKSLLTRAREGSPYWIFDNAVQKLASDALALTLTAGVITGRELGRNKQLTAAVRSIIEVNGNALTFNKDLAERALLVRLDTKLANPGSRKVFRHSSIKTWCRDSRAQLVWACLTIIQNWIAVGKPLMTEKRFWLAGFEDYCRVMGGVLEAAGVTGFNANRRLLRLDQSIDEMEPFVAEWLRIFGTEHVRTGMCGKDALPDANRRHHSHTENLVEMLLDMSKDVTLGLFGNPNLSSLGQRLGSKLQAYLGRTFEIEGAAYQLCTGIKGGASVYSLSPVNGAPSRARLVPGTARAEVTPGGDIC